MPNPRTMEIPAGNSVLGGASGGLSYDGALHDAGAAADRSRRREARRRSTPAAPQTQVMPPGRRAAGWEPGAGPGQGLGQGSGQTSQ